MIRIGMLVAVGILLSGCVATSAPDTKINDNFSTQAINILKPKCESGDMTACNTMGIIYQNINDHKSALAIYKKACENGHQISCTNLANIYQNALGVEKDAAKSISIYKKSCMQGGAYSCFFLGEFYREQERFLDAFNAYFQGCNLLDTPSCTNIGVMYELGLGVNKNIEKALQIYKISCLSGEGAACENMKRIRGQ